MDIMKIIKMLSQHRRDFSALLECEHCGNTDIINRGYDDEHYHNTVIPKMVCEKCGKSAPDNTVPQKPKYPSDLNV